MEKEKAELVVALCEQKALVLDLRGKQERDRAALRAALDAPEDGNPPAMVRGEWVYIGDQTYALRSFDIRAFLERLAALSEADRRLAALQCAAHEANIPLS